MKIVFFLKGQSLILRRLLFVKALTDIRAATLTKCIVNIKIKKTVESPIDIQNLDENNRKKNKRKKNNEHAFYVRKSHFLYHQMSNTL